MKIKTQDGYLLIRDLNPGQLTAVKSWGKFRWNSKIKAFVGFVELETLDKLAELLHSDGWGLPPDAERQRRELHATQDAVDRERVREKPEPMVKYPVKMPLYSHQTRAANMCLLTFGWIQPEGNIKGSVNA